MRNLGGENRISHSVIGCFLIYILIISNLAFASGDTFLDNSSINIDSDIDSLAQDNLTSFEIVENTSEENVLDEKFNDSLSNSGGEDIKNESLIENIENETLVHESESFIETNQTFENESLVEEDFTFEDEETFYENTTFENESLDGFNLENLTIDENTSEVAIEENESIELEQKFIVMNSPTFSIQSVVNGVGREGFVTQSGIYNFVGLDEFIPLKRELLNMSHAFIISPNMEHQENVPASNNGDPATNSDDSFVSLYLYNTTHIRAQRYAEDDGPVVVTWQVIEAMDEEFRVQRGDVSYTGTSLTVSDTIPNSVNVENSMSWFFIKTNYEGTNGDSIQFYSDIINSNTIQFRRATGTSFTVDFRWEVVEWNLEKINNFAKGYTGGGITGADNNPDCFSIGKTINKSSSILFHQTHSTHLGTGGLDSSARAGYIQDDNNVCFYDYDGANTAGVKWFLIDFKDVTKREESTYYSLGTSVASADFSFSQSYDVSRSLAWASSSCNGDGTAKPRHTNWFNFNDDILATGLHVERTYLGQAREFSWQVLELPYFENVDAPTFSNERLDKSILGVGEVVRFSVDVLDSSDGIMSVNGTVDGESRSFVEGSGNEWYYDYTCSSDGEIVFDFVEAKDDGRPSRSANRSFYVNSVCDGINPIVSFSQNTPLNNSEIGVSYFTVNANVVEENFANITFELSDGVSIIERETFSDLTRSYNFTNLNSGEYYYRVFVYDEVGLLGETEIRKIIVDSEPPFIEFIGQTKGDGAIISGTSIPVEVDIVDQNFKNVTFNLYNQYGNLARSPVTYTDSTRDVLWTLVSDGLYYYNVTSYDKYGYGNSTETRNITIDNVFPIVNYEEGVEDNNSVLARDWIYLNGSFIEENFANITFELSDGISIVESETFSDSTRSYNFTGLLDDSYVYRIVVCDLAGNCGESELKNIILDNINPVVSFGTQTADNNSIFSRDWIFVDSVVTEENFANITFRLFDNGNSLVDSQTFSDSTRSYNFTDISSGVYYYNITVYDLAGNIGNSLTQRIGLDLEGPEINILTPQSKAYGSGTDMELTYSVYDEVSFVDQCWFNVNFEENISVDCSGSSSFSVGDGQHSLNFYSNDTFGNIGEKHVSFLVSTTGPAINLNEPINDTVYLSSTNVFFNYSTTDPDVVDSCSLYGSWNGGWHLNQTDFSFGLIEDNTDITCNSFWGFDCGVGPPEAGDNTFDGCANGAGNDESVNNIYLSDTVITPGREITVICEFDPYTSGDDTHIWYYNGTGWRTLYERINWGASGLVNETVTFTVDNVIGTHWVRCGINYYTDSDGNFCAEGSTLNYYDNDDIAFTVVPPKEDGNFTLFLDEEGRYNWNIMCNDSLGFSTFAVLNYSFAIDLTDPLVSFDSETLPNNSRVSSNSIFVSVDVIEENFANITFRLFDSENLMVESKTFFDNTRNYNFAGLSSGIYFYNVTVYDKAGRVGSTLTRKIELDLIKPTGSNTSPSKNYFTREKEHNLTAIVLDDVELEDATLFVYNSTGYIVFSSLIALAGLNSATIGIVYNFLYDDVFSWFYRIRDSANNEYNTTSYNIEIDSTAPIISYISPTKSNNEVVRASNIFVNTSVYEKNYKNMTFWLYNSGQIVSPSPNSFFDSTRSINWTLLLDGVYDYNITSYDLAGNLGVSSTRRIILDTTSPLVSFSDSTMENDSVITGSEIFVGVNVVEANEKNITFDLYNSNGIKVRTNTFFDLRRNISWNLLSSGEYYYNVTVYDKTGLIGISETRKIILDNSLPVVNYNYGTEINNANKSRDWVFVNVSVVEDNFANITFEIWNDASEVITQTFSDSTRSYNFTNLLDGKYYYNVVVYDKAGQSSKLATRIINLDTILPEVEFIFPTEEDFVVLDRDWVFVNVSVVEDNFANITFRLLDGGDSIVDSVAFTDLTRSYNFTNLNDGNYKYEVFVYDWAGNMNATESRNIGLDGDGPIVNILKPKSKTYGYNESLILEHYVYDSVSEVESCWWNIDGGINMSIECNSETTFNTTVDSHVINFYSNDTFGNIGYDSVSFFISITGPAIELFSPLNNSFYGDATNINFSFSANDPDLVDSCSLYSDISGAWSEHELYIGNWVDIGFKHRRDIEISNLGDSTLVNYPIYLNVSSEYTSAGDYYDLRFYNGSCSEEQNVLLDYEIEYYDFNSADVWVKIPQISVGGEKICIYYENDNAEELENPNGVWNSDYAMVYHMDSSGEDSTINNRDRPFVVGNPGEDNSFLGYGTSFGIGNAWDMSNLAWWEAAYSIRSHEAVFETGNDIFSRQVIFAEGGGTNGIMMYIYSGELYVRWWITSQSHYASYPISANEKYHAVMSYNYPGNYSFYLNGVEIANEISNFAIASHTGDGGIGYTGPTGKDFQDVDNVQGYYFMGSIYEFRGMDSYQTFDWANQTYGMIFNSEEVVNYGEEETFVGFDILVSDEGSYLWNVKCNDTIGYDSFALSNYSFIVDVTNPQVFFGSGTADNNYNAGRNWIYVDSNLIENNFKNITFRLFDGGHSIVNSKTFTDSTRSYNFTGLSSGKYYYDIVVYDEANHVGISELRNINLDLSPPTGFLISPLNGTNLRDTIQNLTGSFTDLTGLKNATLFVFNSTGNLIYTSFLVLGGVTSATVGLVYDFVKEGIYHWFYRIEDNVGNIFDTENNTLTIDYTAPIISYSLGVEESGLVFERENIFVNVTVEDLYFKSINFSLYNKDGLFLQNGFIDSTRSIDWTFLPDGFYEYNVTAYDIAGNNMSTETRNITLDNLAPVVDFGLNTKQDGAFISGDEIYFDIEVVEANEKEVVFFLYDSNKNLIRETFKPAKTTEIVWNLLEEGQYYYNATVYDMVDHFSSTTTRSIIIDDTKPGVSYGYGTLSNNTFVNQDWVFVRANVVEENFENITFEIRNETLEIESQMFSDTTRQYNFTGLDEGEYEYRVVVYDKAGNRNETNFRKIVLDRTGPVVNFGLGTFESGVINSNDWIYMDADLTEENFANITFRLFDSENSLVDSQAFSDSTRSYNFTDISSGVYYYNITVYDKAGNSASSLTRNITLDFIGPVVEVLSPMSKAYGYGLGLPLEYSVDDLLLEVDSCWYNIDSGQNVTVDCYGVYSFDVGDGQHTINFYANDSLGNLGYDNVTFLISTTGPAIQLVRPIDESFYNESKNILFEYTAEDPDITQSCSLFGSWNGGWHLNQTDFSFGLVEDNTVRTCSEIWGFDCGASPASAEGDNTWDDCATQGTSADESIEEMWVSHTKITPGQEVEVTCYIDPYGTTNEVYMWYYNGTGWRTIYEGQAPGTANYNLTRSILVDDIVGTHWVRCGIGYDNDDVSDFCVNAGSYFDNDDISFTVVAPKEEGNFTVFLDEEGKYDWNIECNDSRGYYTWAVSNYSITFDVTDPIVNFGFGTLENNSNTSQNFIFVNSSVVENNFKNITFELFNESMSKVQGLTFIDTRRSYNFTGLNDGIYNYKIVVYDKANRFGETEIRRVLLDTKNPSGNLDSPSSNAYSKESEQNLTASFSDENGLKEAILFIFNSTGSLIYSQSKNLGGLISTRVGIVYNFLVDGVFNWFYQVEDIVGNKQNTTSNILIIDTTLPIVNFVLPTIEDGKYVSKNNIYLNLSIVEENYKNITFNLYDVSGVKFSNSFTTERKEINWTNLADGFYEYNVTVWDKAGNKGISETRNITLDRVLPTLSYDLVTEQNNVNKSQNFIYVKTNFYENNFANISYELRNESGVVDVQIFDSEVESVNWTNLLDGVYYYNVTIFDKAGNFRVLPQRKITLDTIRPLVSFTGTPATNSSFERDWIYMNTIVSELNFKNITFRLLDSEYSILNSKTFSNSTRSYNFTASSENETYYYDVIVYDWAGNNRSTEMRRIDLIDITNPSLKLISPANKTYSFNNGLRLTYEAYDVHLDTCWYSLNDGENITLPGCQGATLNLVDETSNKIDLFVNDTLGYMNSTSATFFVNSSLIFTPTNRVYRGSAFVDGHVETSLPQVDGSKSFILHSTRGADNGPDSLQVISRFLDVNTISFENYEQGEPVVSDWVVVSSPNASVQRGEVIYSFEKEFLVEINSVDLEKSFIIVNNRLNSGDSAKNIEGYWMAEFVDSSNIKFSRSMNGSSGELSWQVVSWEGTIVESGNLMLEGGSMSNVSSINQIDLSKSMLIFSKKVEGGVNVQDSFISGRFASDSTLEFSRVGNIGSVNVSYFVVESDLFDVRRGSYNHLLNSNLQNVDFLNELINSTRAFSLNSNRNGGATTSYSTGYVTNSIVDNNTLGIQKGSSVGLGTSEWMVVEMKDLNSPIVNLVSPAVLANYSSYSIPYFRYSVEDESSMKNCSLYGSWNGGWHKNQTVLGDLNFTGVNVGTSGYYNWSIECFDIYENKFMTENRTFAAFLPTTKPVVENISQTSNDGLGNISFSWEPSLDAVHYKIYAGKSIDTLSVLDITNETNYTDNTFSGNRRRFYRVEAWNPSSSNMSEKIIGAHVYTLSHNVDSVKNVNNRNWIGFPTNFSYLKNANDTLNEIAGIESVTRLNPLNQKRVTCNDFSCPESFACTDTNCNFDLEAGVGYEVNLKTTEASEVNWSGVGVVYEPQDFTFVYDETNTRFNKNWVTMTAYTSLNNLYELGQNIGTVDQLSTWDSDNQKSLGGPYGPLPWFRRVLESIEIELEKGYEISVTQDKVWRQE